MCVCYGSVCNVCMCVLSLCVCVTFLCVCMLYLCVCVYTYMCCFCVYVCLCTYVCCLCISYLCVCVCVHLRHRKAGCGNNFSHGWGWDLSGQSGPCTPHHTPPSPGLHLPDFGPGEFLQTQSGCDRARSADALSLLAAQPPHRRGNSLATVRKASLHKSTGH